MLRRLKRHLLSIGLVAALLGWSYLSLFPRTVELSGPLPSFRAAASTGALVSNATLVGKVALINFWSPTWTACVRELPELQAVHRELADRVMVLGVQVNGSAERGAEVLSSAGVTYPGILAPNLVRALSVGTLPYTVLVNPDGTLAKGIVGARDREWLQRESLGLTSR